jgi:hypothetical protein
MAFPVVCALKADADKRHLARRYRAWDSACRVRLNREKHGFHRVLTVKTPVFCHSA